MKTDLALLEIRAADEQNAGNLHDDTFIFEIRPRHDENELADDS